MSNYSDSRRLEALESNVTGIQRQLSELMSMMRQLTQTRTAGTGQHEEESEGTGRGGAHNPNSGAGRVPPTAETSYGVTAVKTGRRGGAAAVEATAAREFTVHNRAASEPADTRPVLPTGVGPMIDVQRGEARDLYLAGITAYDEGRDILRTDIKSLPARVIPPVLKAVFFFFFNQARIFPQNEYVGYNSSFRRPRDASGISRGPAETKGSVVAGRFFERGNQRCLPGMEFHRCRSTKQCGQIHT